MASHQSVSGATETAVSEQSDGRAEPFTNDCSGDAQHFAHAGTAFGAFVSDDYDVAGFYFLAGDRGHGIFFRFKNPRRTAMLQPLMPADLGHATFRRKISFQHDEAAR